MKEWYHSLLLRVALLMLLLPCLVQAEPHSQVRVLFAGDSLMESLGPQVQPALSKHLNWSCLPIGKKSTGLCRPDFYDWPAVLEHHLQAFRPHLVVMWVGTNDNQNICGEKTGGLLTNAWKNAYYRKMLEIISLCRKHHARLIFIGPPVVGDAAVDAELAQISQVMQHVCQHHHVPFLDARPVFADEQGRYMQRCMNHEGKWVDLRTRDKVHITHEGNQKVMRHLYPLMRKTLRSAAPERRHAGTRGNSPATTIRGGRPGGR